MRRARLLLLAALAVLVAVAISLWIARARVSLALDWYDEESCIGCHREINPALVDEWIASAHFGTDADCEGCHGEDHANMLAVRGEVSSTVCAACHRAEYDENLRTAHADTEQRIRGTGLFLGTPESGQRQGCLTCHRIGKRFEDGGQGACNYCHTGHLYSVVEARDPEACAVCHSGPDHPEMEAWRTSKHGVRFLTTRDDRFAPTCVTCHLGGPAGHADAARLGLGGGMYGAVLEGEVTALPARNFSRAELDTRRDEMLVLCRRCHSVNFARRHLAEADDLKRRADRLVNEAAAIVTGLYEDSLLRPMPQDRQPHPVRGHDLALGDAYAQTSEIEQLYFELVRFAHTATFKGAYHFSPQITLWLGYAAIEGRLTAIRNEARRLRAEGAAGAIAPTPL